MNNKKYILVETFYGREGLGSKWLSFSTKIYFFIIFALPEWMFEYETDTDTDDQEDYSEGDSDESDEEEEAETNWHKLKEVNVDKY